MTTLVKAMPVKKAVLMHGDQLMDRAIHVKETQLLTHRIHIPTMRSYATRFGTMGNSVDVADLRETQNSQLANANQHVPPTANIAMIFALFQLHSPPPCWIGRMMMIEAPKQRRRPNQSTRLSEPWKVMCGCVGIFGKMTAIMQITRAPAGTLGAASALRTWSKGPGVGPLT